MIKKKLKIPKKGIQLTPQENSSFLNFSKEDNEDDITHFSMNTYTGDVMSHWLFGDVAIDISGIDFGKKKRFPILEQHDISRKIGVSNKRPTVGEDGVVFDEIKILSNADAAEFKQNLLDEFPYQASISIKPQKTEELAEKQTAEVNGRKVKGPALIVRASEFKESSVCVFGVDKNTSVSASEDDMEEVEVVVLNAEESETKDEGGEKDMTIDELLAKLKEENQEYHDVLAQFIAAQEDNGTTDKEVADLKASLEARDAEIKTLKASEKESTVEYEKRIAALEKQENLRKEKELKTFADNIVNQKLAASQVPERLHDKVRKQTDYNLYVDSEGKFDQTKFSEAVDSEIKDFAEIWEETTKEATSSVLGFGDNRFENSGEEDEDLVSEMLGYVGGTEAKQ